jgi:transposase
MPEIMRSVLRQARSFPRAISPVLRITGRFRLADVPAHNNYVENLIRPFSQGRRVWLFANNPLGARASANLYSLVATARANGIEPGSYLNFLFDNLPATETVDALEALLPWNARSSLPASRRAA